MNLQLIINCNIFGDLAVKMTLWENLKGFTSSRPPLVMFMVCLGAFAIALISLSYYFKSNDLYNPDLTEEWQAFLENFAEVDFCITNNDSDIQIGDFEPPLRLHHIYSKLRPTSHFSRPTNDEVVNTSISMWVEITPTRELIHMPNNITFLYASLNGSMVGLRDHKIEDTMNLTLYLPIAWNQIHCLKTGRCSTVKVLACVNFQAPAYFFPSVRQPGVCYGMNESGAEYHSKMVAIHKSSQAGGKKACPGSPHLLIKHSRDPNINMMLTLEDRSVINLHLMHTSYFLVVMFITLFCYALIRGKPAKPKSHPYTEVQTSV